MAHTYATVAEANDYLKSGGSTTFSSEAATIVAFKRAILEAVSRVIDDRLERGRSGFGPRTGTNRYDGVGGTCLRLNDDLLTVSSITKRDSTAAASTTTLVADTDYYLLNADGEYDTPPYRSILLHQKGVSVFGSGYRVTDVAGTWGYSNTTVSTGLTVSSGLAASASATSFTASAAGLSPGMTLLIESEQLYVTAVTSDTTITVTRGQNGTTAATHANATAISRYTYDARVNDVCKQLFQRRWKAREAGADGTDGSNEATAPRPLAGEKTIINRDLWGLRLKEMV